MSVPSPILARPRQGRMLAGVCAGIARRNGWNVSWVRLAAVLIACFGGGGVLAYLILWAVMPSDA